MQTTDKEPDQTLPRASSRELVVGEGGSLFHSKVSQILGATGVVLLVTLPLTWLFMGVEGSLFGGKLLLGAVLTGIYLATNPQFFRRLVGARSSGMLVVTVLSAVLVLGLVGVVNFFVYQHPKEFDLTRDKVFTLSDQTRGVLGRLHEEVKVLAFYAAQEQAYPEARELLDNYSRASKRFSFEMLDPYVEAEFVRKYQITERDARLVVLSQGQETKAKAATEEEITNAILRVTDAKAQTLYFLTGHAEASLADEEAVGLKVLAEVITAQGYKVETLSLLSSKAGQAPEMSVPQDAAMVVVARAQHKLLQPEVAALERYLDRGGRLLVLLEPQVETGLEGLLEQWKIGVRQDLVVDNNPINRLVGLGDAGVICGAASDVHPIVKQQESVAVLVTARSMMIKSGGRPDVEAVALLTTGAEAWGETDQTGHPKARQRDRSDYAGPLEVAVAASKNVEPDDEHGDQAEPSTTAAAPGKPERGGRVVAFGDADWVSNRYLDILGNRDLILNTIEWLVEHEERISIRPRRRTANVLFLTGEQLTQLSLFSMDILPMLVAALGLSVVLIRRRK